MRLWIAVPITAHQLIGNGIETGDFVGICLDSSADLLVAFARRAQIRSRLYRSTPLIHRSGWR